MKMKRCSAKVPVATSAVIAVLALSLFAFADDLGIYPGAPGFSDTAAIIAPAPAPVADTAVFLKIDGIDGESQDRDHKDWIDILSFDQGQFTSTAGAGGSARGRGGCQFEDVALSKQLDKSSPKLAEAVCKGQNFPKVEIHLTSAFLGGQVYYAYELKNVRVSNYHIGGTSPGDRPTENFSLNFEEIKVTYTEYDPSTGRSQGNVEYTWKVEEGQP